MSSLRIMSFLLAVTVLLAGPVSAEKAEPLKAEQVQAFLATVPQLEALSEKHEDADQLLDGQVMKKDPAGVFTKGLIHQTLPGLEGHAMYGEVESMVKGEGFESIEQWANVGDRVLVGFIHLQMASQAPQMKAQMDMARKQMENMPPEQQAQMQQMMDQQTQVMEAMQNPDVLVEGDVEVVKAHQAEIQAAISPPQDSAPGGPGSQ